MKTEIKKYASINAEVNLNSGIAVRTAHKLAEKCRDAREKMVEMHKTKYFCVLGGCKNA